MTDKQAQTNWRFPASLFRLDVQLREMLMKHAPLAGR